MVACCLLPVAVQFIWPRSGRETKASCQRPGVTQYSVLPKPLPQAGLVPADQRELIFIFQDQEPLQLLAFARRGLHASGDRPHSSDRQHRRLLADELPLDPPEDHVRAESFRNH